MIVFIAVTLTFGFVTCEILEDVHLWRYSVLILFNFLVIAITYYALDYCLENNLFMNRRRIINFQNHGAD